MRRLKEMQEEDRRRKLEELKQHVSHSLPGRTLNLRMTLSISGFSSSEVPRAARRGEETSHRTAEDEGHGQEAAGGGEEEGDRKI